MPADQLVSGYDDGDRRNLPRHLIDSPVSIDAGTLQFKGRMINLGISGAGLISDTYIRPGTGIDITLELVKDYTIQGWVSWGKKMDKSPSSYYYIGIDIESITANQVTATSFSERKKLTYKIISKTTHQGKSSDKQVF